MADDSGRPYTFSVPISRKQTKLTPARLGRLDDDALLDLRLCDLPVRIEGTWLQRCLDRLRAELDAHGLPRLRPHAWVGTEWFSPDGTPGIAVPFYLLHPRLIRLERKMMLAVEGGTESKCMRLLRHETGHCFDTAYRLHRRKRWRELFGRFTERYPDSYSPNPNSRKHVLHLPLYYAQAHPAEDFAETFAVWLTPGSRWRQHYRGWPAMQKLEYIAELAEQVGETTPPVRSRKHIESIREVTTTLREHYHHKQRLYLEDWPDFYDQDLRRIFSDDASFAGRPTAASFLRSMQKEIRREVSRWTGVHPYTIDQVLVDMIDRCKELKLRLAVSQTRARQEALLMLTVQTMKYITGGKHQVPV